MKNRPRNIVLVLSDQQRSDTLGYAGVWKDITPNLDRIGEEGTLFENCFSVQPICSPARACIQSGRFATEKGNYKNGLTIPEDTDTIGKYVKEAGYDTAYIGKWHIYKDHFLDKLFNKYDVPVKNRMGYDFWEASNALEFTSHAYSGHLYDNENHKIKIEGYRADFITSLAIDYLKKHPKGRPFFLTVSFVEPHHDANMTFEGPKGSKEKYKDPAIPKDLEGLKGDYEEFLPDYLGMCANLDMNVGRIEEALKEIGEWEDTVFLYSADHGCHFRTRNSEYKRSCHEASIHVPLVAHGPGFENRGSVKGLTSILDIPASILKAAGVRIPDTYRGKPLQEDVYQEEEEIFVQISEDSLGRCLRTKRWKYCASYDEGNASLTRPDSDVYYESFLYDLENDPAEHVNLVDDPAYEEIRKELKEKLLQKIWEVEGKRPQILTYEEDPHKDQKYSFRMSLSEMLEDEKSRKVIEETAPFLITNKYVHLGTNMKFYFLAGYIEKVPFYGKKIRLLKKKLEALNGE